MQKWEYLTLSVRAQPLSKEIICIIDDNLTKYPYEPPVSGSTDLPVKAFEGRLLDKLGNEGWEMVNGGGDYIFKRPRF